MKIYNHNDKFGDCGPFESKNFETLADEMSDCFRNWALQSDPESSDELKKLINEIREEFINGLEIVTEENQADLLSDL